MTIAEQNQKLLELIGDRRVTVRQLVGEGACLVVNGCERILRGRMDGLVKAGILRKVKLKQSRKQLGGWQFGPRPSENGYEKVGAAKATKDDV